MDRKEALLDFTEIKKAEIMKELSKFEARLNNLIDLIKWLRHDIESGVDEIIEMVRHDGQD